MKGLTLWQPWASLVTLGVKRIETRGWRTSYRGPLLIHAAASGSTSPLHDALVFKLRRRLTEGGYFGPIDSLPKGKVLGVVRLVDCVMSVSEEAWPEAEIDMGDLQYGRIAWMLEDARQFDEPIPWKGSQGVWDGGEFLRRYPHLDPCYRTRSSGPGPLVQGSLFAERGSA